MKKLKLWYGFLFICVLMVGCMKDEGCKEDREKEVVFTIYEDTGYGGALLRTYLTEPLLFSDSENKEIHTLTDILVEGLFDFDYERGYRYTFEAKKIWMSEPPQDASSIKYVLGELLSKEKVITADAQKTMTLFVASETVKFIPRYRKEYEVEEATSPAIYDALYAKELGLNSWMAIIDIEGFNYEEGYEYELSVRKVTQVEPFSVLYVLLDILVKNKKADNF